MPLEEVLAAVPELRERAVGRAAHGRAHEHELQGHEPVRVLRRPDLRQGHEPARDRPRERGAQHDRCRRDRRRRAVRRRSAGARRPRPRLPRRRGDGRGEAALGRAHSPAIAEACRRLHARPALPRRTSTCSRSSRRYLEIVRERGFRLPGALRGARAAGSASSSARCALRPRADGARATTTCSPRTSSASTGRCG